jgi:hypothetical protein
MTSRILFSIVFSGLLVAAGSCKKGQQDSALVPHNYNPTFPDSEGSYWEYAFVDSFTSTRDTITIKVAGKTTLENGQEVSIWAKSSRLGLADTNYVASLPDGVFVYGNRLPNSLMKKYIMPVSVGNYWVNVNQADTTKVADEGSLTVTAGSFSNVFRLYRYYKPLPGNNTTREEEWFVPNVGIVKRNYYQLSPAVVRQERWELVSYQVN